MKKITPDIVPLKGFGELQFGINLRNAFKFLGEPDEIEDVNDKDDVVTTTLCIYDALGLTLFFEGIDEQVLSIIEIQGLDAELFGKKVFTLEEKDISRLMRSHGFHEEERETEEWGEERLSYADALIDFYFEEGKLQIINWGVLVDETGIVQQIGKFLNN
ncbi:MAG: hypothetical protein JEZ03_09740 [Bacteroidales bacterium]|nr:hypothetical protein [Bacteroidales bacterium]